MPSTNFTTVDHGFQFSNRDIAWSFGVAAGHNLCGGMSFSSLDYFYRGIPIPTDSRVPAEGSPLHDYIYGRQMHAHRYAIPCLLQGTSQHGRNEFATGFDGRAFAALRQRVDHHQPLPILLGDPHNPLSTNSHWVAAIGYEEAAGKCARIALYDNNYPNGLCDLVPDESAQLYRHRRGLTYTGTVYAFYVPCAEWQLHDPRVRITDASIAPAVVNPFGLTNPDF